MRIQSRFATAPNGCDTLRAVIAQVINSRLAMSSVSASSLAQSLIRREVLDLHAYHVPPSAGFIKLDAMENPYPVPESLRAEIAAAVAQAGNPAHHGKWLGRGW